MAISQQEWESIYKAISRGQASPEVFEDTVVDVDESTRAVFTSQFADTPILCVDVAQEFQVYSGVPLTSATVRTSPSMPAIGDRIVVTRIAGSNVLRCIGVTKTVKEWEQPTTPVISAPVEPTQAFPVGYIYISVSPTNPGTVLGYGTWVAFAVGRTLVGIDTGDTDFDTVEETRGSKTHTLVTGEMPIHAHLGDDHNHYHDHKHNVIDHNHGGNTGGSTQALDTTVGTARVLPAAGTATGFLSNHTHTIPTETGLLTNWMSAWSGLHATGLASDTVGGLSSGLTNTGNAGSGTAHNNIQPSIVVYMFKRTA